MSSPDIFDTKSTAAGVKNAREMIGDWTKLALPVAGLASVLVSCTTIPRTPTDTAQPPTDTVIPPTDTPPPTNTVTATSTSTPSSPSSGDLSDIYAATAQALATPFTPTPATPAPEGDQQNPNPETAPMPEDALKINGLEGDRRGKIGLEPSGVGYDADVMDSEYEGSNTDVYINKAGQEAMSVVPPKILDVDIFHLDKGWTVGSQGTLREWVVDKEEGFEGYIDWTVEVVSPFVAILRDQTTSHKHTGFAVIGYPTSSGYVGVVRTPDGHGGFMHNLVFTDLSGSGNIAEAGLNDVDGRLFESAKINFTRIGIISTMGGLNKALYADIEARIGEADEVSLRIGSPPEEVEEETVAMSGSGRAGLAALALSPTRGGGGGGGGTSGVNPEIAFYGKVKGQNGGQEQLLAIINLADPSASRVVTEEENTEINTVTEVAITAGMHNFIQPDSTAQGTDFASAAVGQKMKVTGVYGDYVRAEVGDRDERQTVWVLKSELPSGMDLSNVKQLTAEEMARITTLQSDVTEYKGGGRSEVGVAKIHPGQDVAVDLDLNITKLSSDGASNGAVLFGSKDGGPNICIVYQDGAWRLFTDGLSFSSGNTPNEILLKTTNTKMKFSVSISSDGKSLEIKNTTDGKVLQTLKLTAPFFTGTGDEIMAQIQTADSEGAKINSIEAGVTVTIPPDGKAGSTELVPGELDGEAWDQYVLDQAEAQGYDSIDKFFQSPSERPGSRTPDKWLFLSFFKGVEYGIEPVYSNGVKIGDSLVRGIGSYVDSGKVNNAEIIHVFRSNDGKYYCDNEEIGDYIKYLRSHGVTIDDPTPTQLEDINWWRDFTNNYTQAPLIKARQGQVMLTFVDTGMRGLDIVKNTPFYQNVMIPLLADADYTRQVKEFVNNGVLGDFPLFGYISGFKDEYPQ